MRPLYFALGFTLWLAPWLGLLSCSSNIESGINPDAGIPDLATACVGRACMVPVCSGGGTTTITGRLFAGNGADPVPGATIFVPLQEVETKPTGQAAICAAAHPPTSV